MLENRFGRFWADLLLLCVVLGLAAWGLHRFFSDFLLPLLKLTADGWNHFSGRLVSLPPNVGAWPTYAVIVIVPVALASFLWEYRSYKRQSTFLQSLKDRRAVASLEAPQDDLVALVEKLRAENARLSSALEGRAP